MSSYYTVNIPNQQKVNILRAEFAQMNVGPDSILVRDELFSLLDRKVKFKFWK